MKKHTYEYVKRYFDEQGCELMEKQYIGSGTKMRYRCRCGNISKICFSSFKNGTRCKKCGYKKSGEKQKLAFGYVYNCFKQER